MAKQKTQHNFKSALEQAKAQAITPEDAHNLIVLLNRVQVTGVQEAMLLGILAQKLNGIKGDFQGTPSGKDIPPAN